MVRKKYYPIIKDEELISKVENYAEAVNDKTCTWHLHHRNAILFGWSLQEMKDNCIYFHCDPEDLIFLRPIEHRRLHAAARKQKAKLAANDLNLPS